MGIKDLTEWHIEGELWCPDCGMYFDFDGSKPELDKFISDHDDQCSGPPDDAGERAR